MVPVLLSLAASSCWGVADFLGGLQSKRVPGAVVLCVVGGAAAGVLGVALALVAAVGFGSYFVMSDAAADDSVLWLLVLSRSVPVPALALFAWTRGMRPPTGRTAGTLVAAGTLDCGATALYAVANTKGALSIVSVVGSLYPVMTLILARAVLGERIR